MYRWIGAAMIIGAAGWMGWSESAALRRKAALLRELVASLERMERELTFRLTPLPELLSRLGREVSEPLSTFYLSCARYAVEPETAFWRSWQKEAEKLLPDLDRPAVESLCRLGRGLGRYDGEGESLLLKTAAAELREHLSRAEAENIRLGKLYRTLGLTVGAFLILVLI